MRRKPLKEESPVYARSKRNILKPGFYIKPRERKSREFCRGAGKQSPLWYETSKYKLQNYAA